MTILLLCLLLSLPWPDGCRLRPWSPPAPLPLPLGPAARPDRTAAVPCTGPDGWAASARGCRPGCQARFTQPG